MSRSSCAILCHNLLTQVAMPSVLASTCFNASNNRFSSKFTNPVSSPRTRGSSSATSASKMDKVSEVAEMPDLGLRKTPDLGLREEEEGRRERKKE
ncbi:hypothetical protein SLEP1_g53133 [Rubroshorea leprosula]|uniref:Uncharacterized protein n=1 Tax=Rubroshorea leprosula TaxID=152421 RepID=A0AAV5M8L0_9ROSI|nr:hypothetical protein SLEP1_g53133 [Rubroshorea leprosula]